MMKDKKTKADKKKGMIEEDSEEEFNEESEIGLHSKTKKNTRASNDTGINKLIAKKNELKLHKMVLDNFKSFEGKHEIGYFLNFSVVLGPNGSGKSNIIDGLCFALGMKTISLRTKNLRDLVYKKEVDDDNSKRSCSVELVFTKEGEEISFKRSITTKGSTEFFYKNSKVTSEAYLEALEELDIPSKARYFILVQGAIDTILSKKNDLTETIEFLSDSYIHKDEYDKIKAEILILNDEISKLSSEMHSIKDDRNRVKSQIENEERYNEIISKLNSTLNKMYLYKLAEMDCIIKNNEDLLSENEDSLRSVQDDKKALIEFIRNNELEVRRADAEFNKSENGSTEINSLKKHIEEISNKLTLSNENIKLYEGNIFGKISMLNQHKNEKKRKDEKKSQLVTIVENLEKQISEVKASIDGDESHPKSNKKLSKNQIEEYREISNRLEIDSFGVNKDHEKLTISLAEVNNHKMIIEKNITKIENEKSSLENELKSLNEKKSSDEVSKGKLEFENLNNKAVLGQKDSEKNKLELEWETSNKLLQEKLVQLSNLESENLENVKRKKISELMNRNDKVYGFLYELITPLQKKHELPIKVSLVKYLNYLVVENQETSKICSEYMKSKEISSDVLVLSNIPEKEQDESLRLKLGNLGNFVVDLIDCKKKGIKNALNYFLKDLVLCFEKENITKIKAKNFHNIILVDGTLYKKGTIKGGNYKNLEQFSFNYKGNSQEEIEKIRREVDSLNRSILKIEEKRGDYKELQNLKNKIIEKENSIEIYSKNIQMYNDSIKRISETILKKEQTLLELTQGLENNKREMNDLKKKLEEINLYKNSLKEELFKSFLNKHSLSFSHLKDFEPFSITEMKKLSEELKVLEEKLLKANSQIKILESNDELITKLENSLNEEKEKKKSIEQEKLLLEKENKEKSSQYEKLRELRNEDYKKIAQTKELLKLKQNDLDQIDKRIRSLLKNKIEFEHKIVNSIENKKNIIEESKLNIDSYIKDLNNLTQQQNYSVFVSFNLDIERFVYATDTKMNKSNLLIDFKDIESKCKIYDKSPEGHKEKVEALKTKFNEMMKELERYVKLCSLNENEANRLKDKEEELARKKKQTSLQVQNLVNDLEAKKEEFELIKRERKNKFENFFKNLSSKLNQIYKDLTTPMDSLSPGGSAYIYNTNEDEPYLGTVCYLPTPPGKRVIYDIDQLSGGEKTIAILSLVISLQSICHTPFIVLDEIDSYLDPEHEGILEKLFKKQNKNFQIILVTHKSNIFKSAESLIGTYFNKLRFSSIPITVDMTKIY